MTAPTYKLARALADLEAVGGVVEAVAKREAQRELERAADQQQILAVLIKADQGPATRLQMAAATGLSRSQFYTTYGKALDQARNKRQVKTRAGAKR